MKPQDLFPTFYKYSKSISYCNFSSDWRSPWGNEFCVILGSTLHRWRFFVSRLIRQFKILSYSWLLSFIIRFPIFFLESSPSPSCLFWTTSVSWGSVMTMVSPVPLCPCWLHELQTAKSDNETISLTQEIALLIQYHCHEVFKYNWAFFQCIAS